MASIDKRGDVWRARVRIKGFTPKTRSFDTKAEAEQWAARIESQLLAGEDTCPDFASEMTLSEALERYAKEVTPTKKGAEQELWRIRAWQKRPLASLKLSTAAHFSEFKMERQSESKSSNTIRLDLMLISAVFKKARKAWGCPISRTRSQVSSYREAVSGAIVDWTKLRRSGSNARWRSKATSWSNWL